MCIAIIKTNGAKMPSMKTLQNCWDSNPHGAGISVLRGDGVHTMKGLMTFSAFTVALNTLNISDEEACFIHFRIATSGGVTPGMTHPFALDGRVSEIATISDSVLMHNGIIPVPLMGQLSDTATLAMWIQSYGLEDELVQHYLNSGHSKFAVLSTVETTIWGEWIEEDGVHYSNNGYRDSYWDVMAESKLEKDLEYTLDPDDMSIEEQYAYMYSGQDWKKRWNHPYGWD